MITREVELRHSIASYLVETRIRANLAASRRRVHVGMATTERQLRDARENVARVEFAIADISRYEHLIRDGSRKEVAALLRSKLIPLHAPTPFQRFCIAIFGVRHFGDDPALEAYEDMLELAELMSPRTMVTYQAVA